MWRVGPVSGSPPELRLQVSGQLHATAAAGEIGWALALQPAGGSRGTREDRQERQGVIAKSFFFELF